MTSILVDVKALAYERTHKKTKLSDFRNDLNFVSAPGLNLILQSFVSDAELSLALQNLVTEDELNETLAEFYRNFIIDSPRYLILNSGNILDRGDAVKLTLEGGDVLQRSLPIGVRADGGNIAE